MTSREATEPADVEAAVGPVVGSAPEGSPSALRTPPGGMLISRRSNSTVFNRNGERMRPHKPALAENDSIRINGVTSVRPLCRMVSPPPLTSGRGNVEICSQSSSTSLRNRSFKAAIARSRTCGVILVASDTRIAPTIKMSVNAIRTERRRGPVLRVKQMSHELPIQQASFPFESDGSASCTVVATLRLTARFPDVISEKDLETHRANGHTVANEGATVGISKTIDRAH